MPRDKSSPKWDMMLCQPALQSAKLNLQSLIRMSKAVLMSALCYVMSSKVLYRCTPKSGKNRRTRVTIVICWPQDGCRSIWVPAKGSVSCGYIQNQLHVPEMSQIITLYASCILEQSWQRHEATTVSCRAGHGASSSHDITSSLA